MTENNTNNRFTFNPDRLEDLRKQQDDDVDAYLDDPDLYFDSSDEGYPPEELLRAAVDQGVIEQPESTYLWFEFNPGRDGSPWYRFLVTITPPKGGQTVLAGWTDDYPDFVRHGAKNREAITEFLKSAVVEGNRILDEFDAVRAA